MRVMLAISSYSVLHLLLIIRFWGARMGEINVVLFIISVVAGLVLTLRAARLNDGDVYAVKGVEDQGHAAASYLVSFVLPVAFVDGTEYQDILAFTILYTLLIFVSWRSGICQINPTLFCFGYRISKITTTMGSQFLAISKHEIKKGTSLKMVRVDKDLLQVQGEE